MTVQIAPVDHEDAKRLVAILEDGLAPWPAYSWLPQWPAPWILIVDEAVAAELLKRLYAEPAMSALAQTVTQQLPRGIVAQAVPAPPAPPPAVSAPLGSHDHDGVSGGSAPAVSVPVPSAPVKKATPQVKKAGKS